MIGYHPPVGEVHVFLKLYRQHFRIDLHNCSCKPIPYALTLLIFVIAQYINTIPHVIPLLLIRSASKIYFCQFRLRIQLIYIDFILLSIESDRRLRTPSNGILCTIGSKKPSTINRSASFGGIPRLCK